MVYGVQIRCLRVEDICYPTRTHSTGQLPGLPASYMETSLAIDTFIELMRNKISIILFREDEIVGLEA